MNCKKVACNYKYVICFHVVASILLSKFKLPLATIDEFPKANQGVNKGIWYSKLQSIITFKTTWKAGITL